MTKVLLVTAMNMSRLKNVCMSGNMFECRSGTFTHRATLGRFDQRPHKQGKCIMHRHITSRLRTLQRVAVLSGLSIYEYICIKLPASVFVSQPVANMHTTFGYNGLWRFFLFFFGWWEGRSDFFRKHDQEPCPPPHNFRRVPASLNTDDGPSLKVMFWHF